MASGCGEVSSGIILTVFILTFGSICCNKNIYASARYMPSSASLIRDQILSSVPKLSVENSSLVNMNGIMDLLLQTKYTTKGGVFGEQCDINSFVSLQALDSMPRINTAENEGLRGILQDLWLCIAPMPLSQDDSAPEQYLHLGDISKQQMRQRDKISRSRRSAEFPSNTTDETLIDLLVPVPVTPQFVGEDRLEFTSQIINEELRSSVVKSVARTSGSDTNSEFRTSGRIKRKDSRNLVVSDTSASTSTKWNESDDSKSEIYDLISGDSSIINSNRTSSVIVPNVNTILDLKIEVSGIRVEDHSKGIFYEEGTILLQADIGATLLLFGKGLTKNTVIQFTAIAAEKGSPCFASTSDIFQNSEAHDSWALVDVKLFEMAPTQKFWYLCVKEHINSDAVHQGTYEWLTVSTYSVLLPIWIQLITLVFLLLLSGLFSGLNLGLMSLDKTELKVISNTGTPAERHCAKAIEPVRRHGNFLLCTLLLGNVMVNSTLTILLDNLSTGLIAVIGSTVGIVIFGEIIPQAICSRHGLTVGAKTVWLVRMFMVITCIISWPVSKILDYALGEELGSTYNRERLKELIRVQDSNDIRVEEQNIIYGALELHKKTVSEVMTKLSDVFMLDIELNLDFNTINDIMQQGYSRIPIFERERTNIMSVLFIKDLAFIDPDDNTPLRTISLFYQNVCNFVFEDTTLDVIFKEFKEGNKGHMAFVQHVNSEGDCDPFYEVVGLITLEDVIEELIQEEIVDETDVFTDNKMKRRRKHVGRKDFKEFFTGSASNSRKNQISPQLLIAALQFLRTTIEPFKEYQLSESILKRMLKQDIIYMVNVPGREAALNDTTLYVQGKPVDYFILILEGHVLVTIGKENLTFISGPFTYFGLVALQTSQTSFGESPSLSAQISRSSMMGSAQSLDSTKSVFVPDYSVIATTEVTYMKIQRAQYLAARRAFFLEQNQKDPQAGENFEKEMEKQEIVPLLT